MSETVLVVVAHPDDETFGTGSVIAHAAAKGQRVVVCCATRGEAGHDTSGTTKSPEELAAVREGELRAAASVLGAHEVILLDFADSDMQGPMPEHALSAVPIEDVVVQVAGVIERVAPDIVVALDYVGIDDHRDHQRIGEATDYAFRRAAKPDARLYFWTMPQSLMKKWIGEFRVKGLMENYADWDMGRPDAEVTTIIDVAYVADTRRRAIAEHRTQTGPFEGISPELDAFILSRDHFVRAVPAWDGGELETELA
jgi:LmbE family N-acetylglucosaminyl deacetylase